MGNISVVFSTGRYIRAVVERPIVRLVLLYRRLRYGYEFRLIRMSQPRYAKVDPADYERLRKYEWFACKRRNGDSFYSKGYGTDKRTGKGKPVYMHQVILKVCKGMVVDHINNDGMDNRRSNLRAATYSQNMCNREKRSGAYTSKYKGICRNKEKGKWRARIRFEGKIIHLGYFHSEIEAAKARDRAARKYHGEFACLNFPEG